MMIPDCRPLPADRLLATAAHALVALEQTRLPNLGGVTVLLPNLHAANEFGRALRDAAGVETLLLPRFATLKSLAESCDPTRAQLPLSRRQALIYQALRGKDWFHHADLWHISAELLRLFDELTLSQVELPSSYEVFVQRLEQAYRARRDSPLQFEARLVHELWHAMSPGDEGELDDATLYQLQLAHLAETADAPLYAVGLDDLTPLERGFFDVYAQSAPILRFVGTAENAESGTLLHLLATAWAEPGQSAPLGQRAATFRAGTPDSPARGRIAIHGAHGLEQEATAVALRVGQWLAQGKQSVAIVAQDRLVARRARALLERAEVLVADETGWTLSTTSASTVVMRWLDNLDSRFHYQDLLDLLKSPFIFTAWEPARRRHGVFRLEQLIRKHSVVSHLKRYRALAVEEEEVTDILDSLDAAQKPLDRRKPRPLAGWLQALRDSLDILQIRAGLLRDQAGEQLLQLFEQLGRELAADTTPFVYAEWRQWLNQQLEAAVFRDESISSPVVFTHLAACRLRHFDGVIIAGADAGHLPAQGRESAFFNQSVRAQLGLPERAAALDTERRDLLALLSATPEVWISWQERKNDEPNPLSPWFERLEIFHVLAYGESLRTGDQSVETIHAPNSVFGNQPPAPALPPSLIPAAISPSGYNSLVACPYQFYARHALRLNELDEVSLALEKRDYGEYVHAILHRFHRDHPLLGDQDPAVLEQALRQISEQAFAHAIAADFVSHAWALRWDAAIPGYIRWQLAREEQGWRWCEGELEKTLTIELEDDKELVLRGRLDRVDKSGEALAVLDYKTQNAEGLKKKLREAGEDVQLPCYALLMDGTPRQAAFVAVDGTEVRQVEAEQAIADLAQANLARLRDMFAALHRGAPLPAQGTAQACEYCEMRGLCRKDYWNV